MNTELKKELLEAIVNVATIFPEEEMIKTLSNKISAYRKNPTDDNKDTVRAAVWLYCERIKKELKRK
jgi:hypothetical protein